jgi:hypothetical protein
MAGENVVVVRIVVETLPSFLFVRLGKSGIT